MTHLNKDTIRTIQFKDNLVEPHSNAIDQPEKRDDSPKTSNVASWNLFGSNVERFVNLSEGRIVSTKDEAIRWQDTISH